MWLGVLSLRTFATNEIMSLVALAFFLSAMLIWMAPRPSRAMATGAAH